MIFLEFIFSHSFAFYNEFISQQRSNRFRYLCCSFNGYLYTYLQHSRIHLSICIFILFIRMHMQMHPENIHFSAHIFSINITHKHAQYTDFRDIQTVEGMSSVEEEGFQCRSAIPMEGPVESWMSACETEMHSSLQVRNAL